MAPTGNKIVFTHSDSAQFSPQQIYVMNPDGTGASPGSPIQGQQLRSRLGIGVSVTGDSEQEERT
jgi:hypothetical protein